MSGMMRDSKNVQGTWDCCNSIDSPRQVEKRRTVAEWNEWVQEALDEEQDFWKQLKGLDNE